MRDSIDIHTTLDKSTHKKLMDLGEGCLKDGILKFIKIAEGKQGNVKQTLERIANEVLKEITKDEEENINGA